MPEDKKNFKKYKQAYHATDVKFQESTRPSGNHVNARNCFSRKATVLWIQDGGLSFLDERAVVVSKHFRGSISDFGNLCKMRTTHEKWPAEKKGSVLVLDVLPLSEKFPIL